MDPELLERITAQRAELDELEEQLAKQLAEVRAERDELAVAERVSEQLAEERASAAPTPRQVGGRAVMLIPHRTSGGEGALPSDYQRVLAAVRQGGGPVMVRQVGETLGDGHQRAGQTGAAAREAGQAGRPRLASETARRPVHRSPVTRDAAALMALVD